MNYTQNHHLPQWEKDDRIMMEDFNAMCASMESGLNQTAAEAARAVSQAEDTAAKASARAQSTADQAVSAAAKAQATADNAFCPEKMPYAVGTYRGGSAQTVTVGFRPRFLIICGKHDASYLYTRAVGTETADGQVRFTDTGFTVARGGSMGDGSEQPPHLISSGITYAYIAFR